MKAIITIIFIGLLSHATAQWQLVDSVLFPFPALKDSSLAHGANMEGDTLLLTNSYNNHFYLYPNKDIAPLTYLPTNGKMKKQQTKAVIKVGAQLTLVGLWGGIGSFTSVDLNSYKVKRRKLTNKKKPFGHKYVMNEGMSVHTPAIYIANKNVVLVPIIPKPGKLDQFSSPAAYFNNDGIIGAYSPKGKLQQLMGQRDPIYKTGDKARYHHLNHCSYSYDARQEYLYVGSGASHLIRVYDWNNKEVAVFGEPGNHLGDVKAPRPYVPTAVMGVDMAEEYYTKFKQDPSYQYVYRDAENQRTFRTYQPAATGEHMEHKPICLQIYDASNKLIYDEVLDVDFFKIIQQKGSTYWVDCRNNQFKSNYVIYQYQFAP